MISTEEIRSFEDIDVSQLLREHICRGDGDFIYILRCPNGLKAKIGKEAIYIESMIGFRKFGGDIRKNHECPKGRC